MTNKQKNIESQDEFQAGPAKVLMLMGRQCSYCGPMMKILIDLMKQGSIAELKIVNIEENPALATELGVRSVPWLQIGPFELQGARTEPELVLWLQRAASSEGISDYFSEVLAEGKIDYANKLIQRHPETLDNIIDLMTDADAKINVRLGVGAIIEEMAESEVFKRVVPRLIEYLSHDDARVRGDACHYLSLTRDKSHIPAIRKLLSDDSEEVREIAQDSLDDLGAIG
ncbi:MAG TPA: HEAT repeat domain-containing protein [Gammaproteobacteria bacterium]|nr:HEAT repeat domain-containing protein [Gammaproteobacteria bacterium]